MKFFTYSHLATVFLWSGQDDFSAVTQLVVGMQLKLNINI